MKNTQNFNEPQIKDKFVSEITEATEATRKKSFLEKNEKRKNRIIFIRDFYPYLSVLFGVSVAVVGSNLLYDGVKSGMSYYLFVGFWSFIAFLIVSFFEWLKKDFALEFFAVGSGGFALFLLFAFSLVSAGSGGYIGNVAINDQSEMINHKFEVLNDSINNEFSPQIATLDAVIKEQKNRLNSSSKWTRYHAGVDLGKLSEQRFELVKLASAGTKDLKTEAKNEIDIASELTKHKSYLITVLIIIFEILYLYSFYFQFSYYKKVKIENKYVFGVHVSIPELKNILHLQPANQLQVGQSVLYQAEQFKHEPKQDNIGFTFEAGTQPKNDFDMTKRVCENNDCENSFKYGSKKKRFCSSKCQQSNWKSKNLK